jgi:hypothetical protein
MTTRPPRHRKVRTLPLLVYAGLRFPPMAARLFDSGRELWRTRWPLRLVDPSGARTHDVSYVKKLLADMAELFLVESGDVPGDEAPGFRRILC